MTDPELVTSMRITDLEVKILLKSLGGVQLTPEEGQIIKEIDSRLCNVHHYFELEKQQRQLWSQFGKMGQRDPD